MRLLYRWESLTIGPTNCCASRKMRCPAQLGPPAKASASATSALKLRMKRAALVFQSCANLLDTVWDEKCTRSRKFLTTASAVAARDRKSTRLNSSHQI